MTGPVSADQIPEKAGRARADAASCPPPREPRRRGLFARRRPNRRITVARPSLAVWVAESLRALGRQLVPMGKIAGTLVFLAAAAWGGERAVTHVIASPRFAVKDIQVATTTHVRRDEVLALAGVGIGDKLLSIDTDQIASRVAAHPWVLQARVRRNLPSALAIDVVERRAAAVALLGPGLYLVDEQGRPFKRATLEEADGLVVVTGLLRDHYARLRSATEAAVREALSVVAVYQTRDALARAAGGPEGASAARPALSEIHVDLRGGFTLYLLDGGGEIRLGRGDYASKLARLDAILGALGERGPAALQAVLLDGPERDRVTVRLAPDPSAAAVTASASSLNASGAGSKKRP